MWKTRISQSIEEDKHKMSNKLANKSSRAFAYSDCLLDCNGQQDLHHSPHGLHKQIGSYQMIDDQVKREHEGGPAV